MKGKVSFEISNNQIFFELLIERNITVITGDSGTGKTKLFNLVKNYSLYRKNSGITLKCKKNIDYLDKGNWESKIKELDDSIIFIDEGADFVKTYEFAKLISSSSNYYVIISRESLPQIPYSVDAVKKIVKNNRKPIFEKLYTDISVKDISDFNYDLILVEDSKSGLQFFENASKVFGVICKTTNGKTGILNVLEENKDKKVLVVADAAALGSEIKALMKYKSLHENMVELFLPECFEWLILKSDIFKGNKEIRAILRDPVKNIECSLYFSWERYFAELLSETTKDIPNLQYKKNKLAKGYKLKENTKKILNAMR